MTKWLMASNQDFVNKFQSYFWALSPSWVDSLKQVYDSLQAWGWDTNHPTFSPAVQNFLNQIGWAWQIMNPFSSPIASETLPQISPQRFTQPWFVSLQEPVVAVPQLAPILQQADISWWAISPIQPISPIPTTPLVSVPIGSGLSLADQEALFATQNTAPEFTPIESTTLTGQKPEDLINTVPPSTGTALLTWEQTVKEDESFDWLFNTIVEWWKALREQSKKDESLYVDFINMGGSRATQLWPFWYIKSPFGNDAQAGKGEVLWAIDWIIKSQSLDNIKKSGNEDLYWQWVQQKLDYYWVDLNKWQAMVLLQKRREQFPDVETVDDSSTFKAWKPYSADIAAKTQDQAFNVVNEWVEAFFNWKDWSGTMLFSPSQKEEIRLNVLWKTMGAISLDVSSVADIERLTRKANDICFPIL